jgi:hypothetical protein
MKLYQYTEDAVNKILLQRCYVSHFVRQLCLLYKSHVLKLQGRAGQGGKEGLSVQ